MRLSLTVILTATVCSLLLLTKETNGLQCRTGFNTSVYNIPIQFWDDSTQCSTSSEQSCFLGELSYDVSFLSNELSFTYGSCISKAYQSTLECENLIGPNPSFDLDQLSLIIPDLEEQFSAAIDTFSEDAAKEIVTILQNENGQFDNAKIIETFLTALNATPPENTKQAIAKLDSLILTLIVNASQGGVAANEFLSSFSTLGTSNDASSSLLNNVFDMMNISVPGNFKPMIDNLPGFISQYFKNDPNFLILNSTLYRLISSIDVANPQNTANGIAAVLSGIVPSQYKLTPLFDAIPSLVTELMNGNYEYINQWQLNLLQTYSRNTTATHALSSSFFNFFRRIGLYDKLPEEVKTVITYQPGYIYNFIAADDVSMLENVYYQIAKYLDFVDPSAGIDIGQILNSMNLGISLPDQLISVLNGFVSASTTGNVTTIAQYSLESLKEVSILTDESRAMSASIITFLKMYNLTLQSEFEDVITYMPGLLVAAFPNNTALINLVFVNITSNLNNVASTGNIAGFDLASTLRSSLEPLLTLDLRKETLNYLEQLPSQINMSDPIGSLTNLIELSKTIIPSHLNAIIPILNTLPEVFTQIMQGNLGYINTWQLDLLKSVSTITPATEKFSNAIFNMTKRFGIYNNITEDMKTLIMYQPGYFYMFLNGQTEVFEMILNNITAAVDSINPTMNIDLKNLLSMISPSITFPGLDGLLSMFEGFLQVVMGGDEAAIVAYGVEGLKNSSVLTTESTLLSNSIISFISRLNVSLPVPFREIITYFPGVFIATFPEQAAIVNSVYLNISQGLDNADLSSTPDISKIITSTLNQLQSSGVPIPPEVQSLLNGLATTVNINDPIATLGALTMFGLETLKNSTVMTTEATLLGNSIVNFVSRLNVSIPEPFGEIITYFPGIFITAFPEKTTIINIIFYNISQGLDSSDISITPDISKLISSTLQQLQSSGVMLPPEVQGLLSGLASAVNLTDPMATLEGIGVFGLEALKNSSVITAESTLLGNSIINFVSRLNASLPTPLGEIVTYVPGLFIPVFPEQATIINSIYVNISQALDNADVSTNPDISNMIALTLQQLQSSGVTFPPEMESLVNAFVPKINISDPVATYEALLEVLNPLLLPFNNDTLSLLNAVPDLLRELVQGNFNYINTWQVNLLKLYSTPTEASMALSNSIFELLKRFGVYDSLTEDYKTLITYQPGYFYQFFSEEASSIDMVYYNISAIIDGIGTTMSPDLQELLKRMDSSIDLTGFDPMLDSIEKLITAASTGNASIILSTSIDIIKNFSTVTTDSAQLSSTVISVIEIMLNTSLPSEVNDLITYAPGIFYFFLPEQESLINLIYQRLTQSIQDSYSGNVNLDPILNDALAQLQMANITLPAELMTLFNNFQSLLDSIISNNETAIDNWFTKVLPLISPTSTAESSSLSNAIRHVVYQINGFPRSQGLDTIIEYLPRMPYRLFLDQTAVLNTVYTSIVGALNNINLTSSEMNFGDLFGNIDISMLPPELIPFLNSTQDLIAAAMTNDETLWLNWVNLLQAEYCESNTVTVDFGKAFFEQMNQFDTKLPASLRPALECIPGTMYKFFPSETIMLDGVFGQMTTSVANYSDFIASQFKRINQTIPDDLATFLESWQKLQPALMSGNFSEVVAILTQMNNNMARETELSKLIETLMGEFGVVITDEIRMYIRQSTVQVYNPALGEYLPTFDTIFSSLNTDIAAGKDIGVAIKDAFANVNIEIYDRIIPVLDNLQSLMDAAVSNDAAGINQAILGIMISYNESFPSDQTQYAIYQYRLQLVFMNLNPQSLNIPDEAFEYMGEMYRLMLKMFETSEDELKEMLLKTFPTGEVFIEIFFTFDPKEAFSVVSNFVTWFVDPGRNSTTLANHIKSAIEILMSRYDIDFKSLLSTIAKPSSCKYDVCDTDGCNGYGLVKDLEPVTPVPEEKTTPTTTTPEPTTTTVTTTPTTVEVTQTTVTTTSGQVISSTNAFSWSLYLVSAILSLRWISS